MERHTCNWNASTPSIQSGEVEKCGQERLTPKPSQECCGKAVLHFRAVGTVGSEWRPAGGALLHTGSVDALLCVLKGRATAWTSRFSWNPKRPFKARRKAFWARAIGRPLGASCTALGNWVRQSGAGASVHQGRAKHGEWRSPLWWHGKWKDRADGAWEWHSLGGKKELPSATFKGGTAGHQSPSPRLASRGFCAGYRTMGYGGWACARVGRRAWISKKWKACRGESTLFGWNSNRLGLRRAEGSRYIAQRPRTQHQNR